MCVLVVKSAENMQVVKYDTIALTKTSTQSDNIFVLRWNKKISEVKRFTAQFVSSNFTTLIDLSRVIPN